LSTDSAVQTLAARRLDCNPTSDNHVTARLAAREHGAIQRQEGRRGGGHVPDLGRGR
jgi:hypothetical protein